jgi:hypothetical protein
VLSATALKRSRARFRLSAAVLIFIPTNHEAKPP